MSNAHAAHAASSLRFALARAASVFLILAFAANAQTRDANEADTGHSASLANVTRLQDAQPADLAADATYLLPGFFDKNTTLDNVRRRFGAANLRVEQLNYAEDMAEGLVLFAGDPARRLEILYADPERKRGVGAVRVRGKSSRWHFGNGVKLGMTLDALVALNGKPISFLGLDWDYGGNIADYFDGKLAPKSGANEWGGVSLTHAENATGYPMGEDHYRSDDKRYPKLGTVLYVGELYVNLSDGD